MSKVLVVYGSKSGCTVGVAEKIAETLAATGAAVEVVAAEKAGDARDYDAVVVGSGVRMGQWHEPVRSWVAANASALATTPTAFYTCCLTLARSPEKTDEVRAYTDTLIAETGVTPVDIGLFAGWNEPKRFSLLERMIMKAMKAPVGDFRDFSAVASWATSTASALGIS